MSEFLCLIHNQSARLSGAGLTFRCLNNYEALGVFRVGSVATDAILLLRSSN